MLLLTNIGARRPQPRPRARTFASPIASISFEQRFPSVLLGSQVQVNAGSLPHPQLVAEGLRRPETYDIIDPRSQIA